jgi:hypothetical protein
MFKVGATGIEEEEEEEDEEEEKEVYFINIQFFYIIFLC